MLIWSSPLELRHNASGRYRADWPWMQERLTWFANDARFNGSLDVYPHVKGKWTQETPWCYGALCHRNSNKMPYIRETLATMWHDVLDCAEGAEFSSFCGESRGKPRRQFDPGRLRDLVEAILPRVTIETI